jgi:prepilin-type N-terminal cleavage/methylation domain-containing protein
MAIKHFSGKTPGPDKNSGFSLIELSIVLLILGLMIGGIMAVMTQEARTAKQAELKAKMDAVEQAIIAYAKKNNRLPCPADGTYLITNSYFGVEGGTIGAGTCSTGASYSSGNRTANPTPPTANFYITNLAGGVVPVRTLGLPDEYAFDPWGGRFNYAVDSRLTANNALSSTYFPTYSATGITVNDNSGNNWTTSAITVVFSNGLNGHGAFQLSGIRKSAGSTNANEQANCHCNSSAEATAYTSTFIMGTNSVTNSSDLRTGFDDVLRYYKRGDFLTATDIITEKTK